METAGPGRRGKGEFRPVNELEDDPWRTFERWYADAVGAEEPQPDAMTLATASAGGKPSARIVLYKGRSQDGLLFFTNFESRKGQELLENPEAALVFHWPRLQRQVRVEGSVLRLKPAESDAYFRTRPRESQISAWASPQSRAVVSRQELELRARHVRERYAGGEVERPEFWGGYRLVPRRFEFWVGQTARLHDRFLFTREGNGPWRSVRLAP
jgi:pyridoxamine 5'-phosphate oxidase